MQKRNRFVRRLRRVPQELQERISFRFRKIRHRSSIWSVNEFVEYEDYLRLQRQKTLDPERRSKWLGEEWSPKVQAFMAFFGDLEETLGHEHPEVFTGRSMLCLGARTGQEVVAAQELSWKALGVDLVPHAPLVIGGDVHALPFQRESFWMLYSNVVDHALKPQVMIAEMERVARPGALIVLHLSVGRSTDPFGVTEIARPNSINHFFHQSEVQIAVTVPEFLAMNALIVAKKK